MIAHPKIWAAQLVCIFFLLPVGSAAARPAVAVLPFNNGESARDVLIQKLERRYEVIPGQEIIAASESLGITMSRGENLARLARHVGVVAIIGGAVQGNRLTLAVYSGKTGQPLATGGVAYRRRFTAKGLRQAEALIARGLKRAPKRMPRPRAQPAPPPEEKEPTMTFEPEPQGSGTGLQGAEENPLEPPPEQGGAAAPGAGGQPGAVGEEEPVIVARAPREAGASWIEGTLGLGIWMRSFELVDTVNPQDGHPSYSSGAAFTLDLGLRARPLAFFTDNFASNFWLRLRYKQALGLKSKSVDSESAEGGETTHGTTMREFLCDFGYDWKLLDRPLSPHLDFGFGYGLTDFSIDWQGAQPTLPNFAYRYLLFGATGRYNFYQEDWGLLGAHLAFDYRVVLSPGEEPGQVAADESWYGSSSTGGINVGLGLDVNISNILIKLDYAYTRYFYTFNGDAEERGQDLDQRGAAGALDQFHLLLLSGGYAY